MYFDGHNRGDVVLYRNNFLMKIEDFDKKSLTCANTTPELAPGKKPFICIVHVECIYYANSDQSYFRGDEETSVQREKSLGASIVVSDFIDEMTGYVRDNQDQARLLLETHREGYFTNDHLLEQVARTIDIFERVNLMPQPSFFLTMLPPTAKWLMMY